ncbi:MAG: decaprenyl-phosphate phosphoribosyltransferase [Myxococcota bacterium]
MSSSSAEHGTSSPSLRGRASSTQLVLGLIQTLRPKQWVKNLFVLAPLFFSKQFLVPSQLALGLLAALVFSLTSGTIYVFNDICDLDKDRLHPVKRHRPIPSGQLPLKAAWGSVVALGGVTQALAWLIDWRLGAVTTTYTIMNLAYSTVLKHVPFVDVTIIATGFVLRVLAGAFAIDVFISEWLVICTFLLALYLGFGKRLHELTLMVEGRASKTRRVLKRYRLEHLDFVVLFVAGLTIAAYTVYTMTVALPNQPLRSQHTPFTSPYLPVTIPFAVMGITRFYQLLKKEDELDSPTELILKDWPFIVNLLAWGVLTMGVALAFPGPG